MNLYDWYLKRYCRRAAYDPTTFWCSIAMVTIVIYFKTVEKLSIKDFKKKQMLEQYDKEHSERQ